MECNAVFKSIAALLTLPLAGILASAHAEDSKPAATVGVSQTAGAGKAAESEKKLPAMIEALKSIDPSLSGAPLELINQIVTQTRTDQSVIYLFTKSIDEYMDKTSDRNFANCVRKYTKRLQDSSYSDSLFQNANLSNQIKTRIESITLDAAKFANPQGNSVKLGPVDVERKEGCRVGSDTAQQRFLDELDTFSMRFLQSKRFRLGVGAEYLYLPQISYPSAPSIDLTGFQAVSTSQFGGGVHAIGLMDFSNKSVSAIRLSAKVPEGQLDVSRPSQSQTNTLITNVNRVAISTTASAPDLLTRTTIESVLKPEYDASITTTLTGVKTIWRELKNILSTNMEDNDIPRLGRSWEVAFGLGTTGFRVSESATTDVRLRTDASKTFAELASSGSVSSQKSFVFRADYLRLDFSLQVSDELNVGLATRFYRKANIDAGPVNIKGAAISMYAVWYPTFGW